MNTNPSLITKLKNYIRDLDYLPRWIIFCMDVSLVMVSIVITYLMMLRVGMYYVYPNHFYSGIILLLGVHAFFLLLFRIYSGIIRHSSFIDGIKLFVAEAVSVLVLFAINQVLIYFYGIKILLNTGLIINAVLIFTGLFSYRIVIKYIFDKYLKVQPSSQVFKAMIYGSDANAISVANALINESPQRFKLVAFIDSNLKNKNKRLFDLPILQTKKRYRFYYEVKEPTL